MKLSDLFLSPIASLYVIAIAFAVTVGIPASASGKILQSIVSLTKRALPPIGISASIQGPSANFKQTVVGVIRADDKVVRVIVRPDAIHMMYFFRATQVSTQSAFGNQNVLQHITSRVRARMLRSFFKEISSLTGAHYPAFPMRVLTTGPARVVVSAETKGFSLNPFSAGEGAFGYGSGKSASTLTKTRRIQQNRAPNVCADNTTNLTHSGGFHG